MKKQVIIVFFLLIGLSIGFLIIKANSFSYIIDTNENTQIAGLKLLMNKEDIDITSILGEGFEEVPGFGCWGYEGKKNGLRIGFSGFPDVLDEYVLTEIITVNPEHSFYNIHVGDNFSESIKTLEEQGFKSIEGGKGTYEKKQLWIILVCDDNIIEEIKILLHSTNKEGVHF